MVGFNDPVSEEFKSLMYRSPSFGIGDINQNRNVARDSSAKYGNRQLDPRSRARDSNRNRNSNARRSSNSVPFTGSIASAPNPGLDNWAVADNINSQYDGPVGAERVREDFIREVLERLKDPFEFSGNALGAEQYQKALDAQIAALTQARQQAQSNFNISDANVEAMHEAHRQDVLGQAGDIRERNADYQNDLSDIFQRTISDANERRSNQVAEDTEMYKRLGLEDVLRFREGPSELTRAINETIGTAEQSEDARLAEAESGLQTALSRNTGLANAIGMAGVERRSDLNDRLQDIFGDLSQAEAGYRGEYANNIAQATQAARQQEYEQWLAGRQFDMGLLDQYDAKRRSDEQFQREQEMLMQEALAESQQMSGYAGMNSQYDPSQVNAFVDATLNASSDPEANMSDILSVIRAAQANGSNVDARQYFDWLTQYRNL